METKKIKFNGNLYPYVDINVYDYNLNRDRVITVASEDLYNDVNKALLNGNKELKKKAEQFDLPVELFVPKDMLLLDDEERIARFVSESLPKL
jgi:hypothetical protein